MHTPLSSHARQLPRIAGRLYAEPWNILPSQHGHICDQFRAALERPESFGTITPPEREPILQGAHLSAATTPVGPAWRDEDGQLHHYAEQVLVLGSTAILPVRGVLGKHLSTLDLMCGGADYAIIEAQARNIAADPMIDQAILYLDTPGGNCIGNLECAQALRALAATKPLIAYTDTLAASAGYMLASAAHDFHAAPSAIIGSISTYSAFLDSSRRYEMEGLEVKMFRSGKYKGAGYPGKEWTEDEEREMQRMTDEYSAQFKGFVASRRGLTPDLMQGQTWVAQFAPAPLTDSTRYNSLTELLTAIS